MSAASWLWQAAGLTSVGGLYLLNDAVRPRHANTEYGDLALILGVGLLALSAVVLLPAAIVASLGARRRRIAERLGIAPPSGGLPDQDLGAGRAGDEPR